MRLIDRTTTFKKCLKKYRHNGPVLRELKKVVDLLAKDKPIPKKYKDHGLQGNYKGTRELHLKPDDLLLYLRVDPDIVF